MLIAERRDCSGYTWYEDAEGSSSCWLMCVETSEMMIIHRVDFPGRLTAFLLLQIFHPILKFRGQITRQVNIRRKLQSSPVKGRHADTQIMYTPNEGSRRTDGAMRKQSSRLNQLAKHGFMGERNNKHLITSTCGDSCGYKFILGRSIFTQSFPPISGSPCTIALFLPVN